MKYIIEPLYMQWCQRLRHRPPRNAKKSTCWARSHKERPQGPTQICEKFMAMDGTRDKRGFIQRNSCWFFAMS